MGGLLALVEGEPLLKGFLYVTSNMLQFSTPLTDYNPSNPAGVIIDIYVSVMALLAFGMIINVVRIFHFAKTLNALLAQYMSETIIPWVALCLIIPALVALIGSIFGVVMAIVEGWSHVDGILYVYANLMNLGTALTDQIPQTVMGDIVDVLVSSMAMGVAAIFVDYVAIVNPAKFIEDRTTLIGGGKHAVQTLDHSLSHHQQYESREHNLSNTNINHQDVYENDLELLEHEGIPSIPKMATNMTTMTRAPTLQRMLTIENPQWTLDPSSSEKDTSIVLLPQGFWRLRWSRLMKKSSFLSTESNHNGSNTSSEDLCQTII